MESIGRLAGGVAHDLNNLLSPILGYSDLLMADSTVHDAHKKKLKQIINASLRARELVHQLLAFGRKQILEYKPFDLNRVLSEFEALMRRVIREDIEIKIIRSPLLKPVTADRGQIEQVIMNLAVNAADAMPQGGTITIETAAARLDERFAVAHPGATPGTYALLCVSDTGCGMDEQTRLQIFEPFFSTKGTTGLGLATVYGIVKQHKGNIWVSSEPGKGTIVKVYLPMDEAQFSPVQDDEQVSDTIPGTETILLVEDSDQVRDIVRDILNSHGYTVIAAGNATEALQLLQTHHGDIQMLLTDVVMPDMNGKQLYEKATQFRPALKVLFMSGYTNNVVLHQAGLEEGIQFIQKPFTTQALAAKVRRVLED